MQVAIRADASVAIGTGHIMRMLALANTLREAGDSVYFVMRQHAGHMVNKVQEAGFKTFALPTSEGFAGNGARVSYESWLGVPWEKDLEQTRSALSEIKPDWLVVDHYAIDDRWEKEMRKTSEKILALDDLADRKHDCDILVDCNLNSKGPDRYRGLVPQQAQLLMGPRYAFLRPEFRSLTKQRRVRDNGVQRLLIFLGGSDPLNLTSEVLEVCSQLKLGCQIDVVIGSSNPHATKIKALCEKLPKTTLHLQTPNLAQLCMQADLAVGGGGVASWERVVLGLPSIVIPWADNQLSGSTALASEQVLELLPLSRVSSSLAQSLKRYFENPAVLAEMSKGAIALDEQMDSTAGTLRIAQAMKEMNVPVRMPS